MTGLLLWALVRWAVEAVARVEAVRRESEERHRQVFERTNSVCVLVDIDTLQIVDANPAAVQFYGWTRPELLGMRLPQINTMEETALHAAVKAAADAGGKSFVVRHRLRSGAERDVEVHCTPIHLAGRRVNFSIVHDITERLGAERRLAESEANYRRALEQASDAIVVGDREGVVLEANSRAEELFGRARAEIIGHRMEELVSPADRERFPLNLRELFEGGAVLHERRLARKDGVVVEVEISARELGDGRYQAIIRDISERRRLEEQLRQAQKMEAVGQLTGGIAHDLNNLLTVVLANSEMIAGALPPGRQDLDDDLRELQAAARRGAQMIRKLLSFSRRAPLTFQVLDLGRVVGDVLDTLRRLLPAHIEIKLQRDGNPVKALADAGAVEQVVINLATNARDAMPNGGLLQLDVSKVDVAQPPAGVPPGRYARLTVRDTGLGMDERVKARAFEPFFTTKPPGEGSGLGMSMVYGLTQQHGGFVELESTLGRGTMVRVFLPLAGEDHPLPQGTPAPGSLRGGRETILLVEDEDGLRRVAQRALERVGYRVLTAADGLEALELYRRGAAEVDLVITDVVMPRLGGIALYRTLRQEGHNPRILFTSGYSAAELTDGDFPEAELVVLQKPWTLADLTQRVRNVLDRG